MLFRWVTIRCVTKLVSWPPMGQDHLQQLFFILSKNIDIYIYYICIYIYIDIKEKNKQSFFIFSCPGFSSTRLPVFLRSWALGSHWSPPSGIGCCDCWGSVIHTSWKYRASLWVFLHVFMHVKRNLGRSPCDWIEWIEYMYNHVYI